MFEQIKATIGQYRIAKRLEEIKFTATPITVIDIETSGENKQVGDSPYYTGHGIAGIALGNLNGDAVYLVLNDSRSYDGIPIADAIKYMNEEVIPRAKVLVCHYGKFDLGFLLARGLKLNGNRLIDTWAIANVSAQGNYTANKLKDIIRTKLGIATDTEGEKDKWMEENGTLDYGDVPPTIMGKYAADDTKYSLLVLLSGGTLDDEHWDCHDVYIRNHLHLIAAEKHGICVNTAMLRERLEIAIKSEQDLLVKIKGQLGSAQVDIADDQAMLRYLHEKNLHSGPREMYGETQYVFDAEFLQAVDSELTSDYFKYHRFRDFKQCFSGAHGEMGPRIFQENTGNAGFHVSQLLSIFSKGGLVLCKMPDLTDRVPVCDEIRKMFVPRKGFKFVTITACDLPLMLLAHYCKDAELLEHLTRNQGLTLLANRSGFPETACAILLRQVLEGSGMELLERRMRGAKVKGIADKKKLYRWRDVFEASLGQFCNFKANLSGALKAEGAIRDRGGRLLRIEEKKLWRAHAMLLQSSNGGILTRYLDAFCRLAGATGAQLVLAHEAEFIFETPIANKAFVEAAFALSQKELTIPKPIWAVRMQYDNWQSAYMDAHKLGGPQ